MPKDSKKKPQATKDADGEMMMSQSVDADSDQTRSNRWKPYPGTIPTKIPKWFAYLCLFGDCFLEKRSLVDLGWDGQKINSGAEALWPDFASTGKPRKPRAPKAPSGGGGGEKKKGGNKAPRNDSEDDESALDQIREFEDQGRIQHYNENEPSHAGNANTKSVGEDDEIPDTPPPPRSPSGAKKRKLSQGSSSSHSGSPKKWIGDPDEVKFKISEVSEKIAGLKDKTCTEHEISDLHRRLKELESMILEQ